jgi:NAD(P)H dehydrogenase (quinone)
MPKTVYVIIYSLYGHIKTLADEVVKGLESEGIVAKLYQVAETLSPEIIAKMHGQKLDLPVITAQDLPLADGYIFGIPTRFGVAPAQVKQFWDSTGQLWFQGALKGKYAATFFSSANLGGGQETTAMTFLPNLVHHGIIYVPLGSHAVHANHDEIHGGSYWGAGTVARPDGSRVPSALEKELALAQGKQFAGVLNRLK